MKTGLVLFVITKPSHQTGFLPSAFF